MATRQNLIDTYNSNPTLQSKYTLPQYLALFDFGTTTTPTPTPTPTPDPTSGIPNIINQNLINPSDRPGDETGPQNIPERKQYFDKTYVGDDPNYVGPTTFPDGTPIMGGLQETKGPGFFDQLANTMDGLVGLYQTYSPVGMITKAIQDRKDFRQSQTDKALEQVAIQQAIRDAEAAERARQNAVTYRYNNPSQKINPGDRGNVTSDAFKGGGANVPSSAYTDRGREGYGYGLADGGRVYLYNRLK